MAHGPLPSLDGAPRLLSHVTALCLRSRLQPVCSAPFRSPFSWFLTLGGLVRLRCSCDLPVATWAGPAPEVACCRPRSGRGSRSSARERLERWSSHHFSK